MEEDSPVKNTPRPVASSTTKKNKFLTSNLNLDHTEPEDDSLGILSLSSVSDHQNLTALTGSISALPSCYFRPNENSVSRFKWDGQIAESTLNEETLEAAIHQQQQILQDETPTFGRTLEQLKNTILNDQNCSFENAIGHFNRTVGEFFKGRSDSLTSILPDATSPPTRERAFPLIDTTNCISNETSCLSVSKIAKIISDSEQTPTNFLHQYYSNNKFSKETNTVSCSTTETPSVVRSISSLSGGRLPLESSKVELIWGCVRLGKSETDNFSLRNRFSGRLRITLTVTGNAFKLIHNTDNYPTTILKLVLLGHETKSVKITFAPVKIGPACEDVIFSATDPHIQQHQRQYIKLYGYGGNSHVEIENVTNDLTEKYWLSMGALDFMSETNIQRTVSVKNAGQISTFTRCEFVPHSKWYFSRLDIVPGHFVLKPNESKVIQLKLTPHRNDFNHLNRKITGIGVLKVVSGTMVNRWRLQRLYVKAQEQHLEVDQWFQRLMPELHLGAVPPEMSQFNETLGATKYLLEQFTTEEIMITVEQDLERTLIPQYSCNSSDFQTLYHDDEDDGGGTLVKTTNLDTRSHFTIQPLQLLLVPQIKCEDFIIFASNADRTLEYRIDHQPSHGIALKPSKGRIKSGEKVFIQVKCTEYVSRDYIVTISVENHTFTVEINVLYSVLSPE